MLLIRKILFIFTILALFTGIFSPFARAQTFVNPYATPLTNTDVPQNLHTLVQSLMIESLSSIFCVLAGVDVLTPNHQCLGIDPSTHRIGYEKANGGLVGITGNMIAQLYVLPVSSSDYISYLSQHFKFLGAGKAYADNSIGQITLDPLLGIWVGFRNITYLLLVLAFIILGVLIMIRVKIDPRTVMTLQNQIPKVIIGIILITFSFAIAGVLIDLMYVITYIGLSILGNVVNNPSIASTQVQGATVLGFIPQGAGALASNVGAAAGDAVNSIIGSVPLIGGLNGILGFI
ncbi:MAG: hypothetical protein KGL95_15765, partial [Patescibacteria group bacterium]|nr:hypothetical protein [Patescibacteria group bacterium]